MQIPADADETAATASDYTPPPGGSRTFFQVLVNTAVANVTTSYLWFALTFWVYLETRSVLATGIIGGAYMLLVAIFSMLAGAINSSAAFSYRTVPLALSSRTA